MWRSPGKTLYYQVDANPVNAMSSNAMPDINIWPDNLQGETLCENPTILAAQFEDMDEYHDALIRHILELEKDTGITHTMQTGSSKVKHLHTWDLPEARLITERALMLYGSTSGVDKPEIQLSWATVYRSGDYLTPHGHPNANGTVNYCLDNGDPDYQSNLYAGKLVFVDPRIEDCCSEEADCATRSIPANLREGKMVLFPGSVTHFVHPYNGTRPRITLTWNIN